MAREFGGRFSPGGDTSEQPANTPPKAGAGFRSWLMFAAPLPLLLTGFGQITAGNPAGIVRDFTAFALLILAAWLLREGLFAEAAFNARTRARRPALPRKILAAALCGAGITLAAWTPANMILPPTLGILAMILHLSAFGIDPLKSKGIDGYKNFPGQRVARAVDEAESYLAEMTTAMAALNDRQLQKRLDGFTGSARAMFRTIEEDPRDLNGARRYLSVYLIGARDATVKFVTLYQNTGDARARSDYETLLADLQANFVAQRKEMLLDDRSDLDVEIEVLRERLRHEGVQT
ncbi:MAG: 5-bromo-4-chloroindolyl phosphate hydrolysis family protein [Rhodobacteraceae bacterium]|nr:5-bromo-4-chloroindolyl phosphate hydrolysis family protein [Paracoccaceae bacterium]